MESRDFPVSVTDLSNYRFGDKKRAYGAIADKGVSIDLDQEYSNSEMLYEELPQEVVLAGLIQADLQYLMSEREPGLTDFRDEIEDEAEKFYGILVDGIRARATDEIDSRLEELQAPKYGVDPGEVLDQDLYGRTVRETLKQVAGHRSRTWWADIEDFYTSRGMEPEKWLEDEEKRVRGRADLVIPRREDDAAADEIREIKMSRRGAVPRDEHEYQAAVYTWLAEDLGLDVERTTLEYPLRTDEIFEVDTAKWRDEIEQDRDEFIPLVESFTGKQERRLEHLLERETGAERREDETIEEYRDRAAETAGTEKAEQITKQATQDAINDLETQKDSLENVLDMLEGGPADLASMVNQWEEEYGQQRRGPLWDALRDLYDAGIVDRYEGPEGLVVEYSDDYTSGELSWEDALSKVNELSENWVDGTRHMEQRYFDNLEPSLLEEHFSRHGWDTFRQEGSLVASSTTTRGDKQFTVNVEKNGKMSRDTVTAFTNFRKRAEVDREPFFSPRHFREYVDQSTFGRIQGIQNRKQAIDRGVEQVMEKLGSGESEREILTGWDQQRGGIKSQEAILRELNSVSGTGMKFENASELGEGELEQLVRATAKRYYDPGTDIRPSKLVLPLMQEIESHFDETGRVEEGLMPLGETRGESISAEQKRRRNQAYLEYGLREITERMGLL